MKIKKNMVSFKHFLVSQQLQQREEVGQHEKGAKLDKGKIKAALVLGDFAAALEAVSEVGTFGANKYSRSGWVHVENGVERYMDAMMRHLLKHWSGEVLDEESGLPHLSHACWNSLAVLQLTRVRNKED